MLDRTKRISIYQPEQPGLIFPEIAEFKTHAEERQHRKERLVAACRAFDQQGFDYGFAGHLTVRDPEHPSLYWTNPMAVHFSRVKVSNLILVDHEGRLKQVITPSIALALCCTLLCTRRTPTLWRCATHTPCTARRLQRWAKS